MQCQSVSFLCTIFQRCSSSPFVLPLSNWQQQNATTLQQTQMLHCTSQIWLPSMCLCRSYAQQKSRSRSQAQTMHCSSQACFPISALPQTQELNLTETHNLSPTQALYCNGQVCTPVNAFSKLSPTQIINLHQTQTLHHKCQVCPSSLGNGPNTVSESTVSNTKLSECFGAHWVLGSELSEFLSAYYLCAKANSPSFSQNSPSLPRNSVRLSEFFSPKQYSRNSIPPVSYSLFLSLTLAIQGVPLQITNFVAEGLELCSYATMCSWSLPADLGRECRAPRVQKSHRHSFSGGWTIIIGSWFLNLAQTHDQSRKDTRSSSMRSVGDNFRQGWGRRCDTKAPYSLILAWAWYHKTLQKKVRQSVCYTKQPTKGYQNRWVSKSQVLAVKLVCLVHQQFWYPFGWFFGTQKAIKTDGFWKWQSLGTFNTRNFGAPVILVPVWVFPIHRLARRGRPARGCHSVHSWIHDHRRKAPNHCISRHAIWTVDISRQCNSG